MLKEALIKSSFALAKMKTLGARCFGYVLAWKVSTDKSVR